MLRYHCFTLKVAPLAYMHLAWLRWLHCLSELYLSHFVRGAATAVLAFVKILCPLIRLWTIANSGYFALIKYGLNASMWESFMTLEMQHQLMEDCNNVTIKIACFNCKSLRSSLYDVKSLCETRDLVFLQETWFMPHNTSILHSTHDSFYGGGVSAVNTENGILVGRP